MPAAVLSLPRPAAVIPDRDDRRRGVFIVARLHRITSQQPASRASHGCGSQSGRPGAIVNRRPISAACWCGKSTVKQEAAAGGKRKSAIWGWLVGDLGWLVGEEAGHVDRVGLKRRLGLRIEYAERR